MAKSRKRPVRLSEEDVHSSPSQSKRAINRTKLAPSDDHVPRPSNPASHPVAAPKADMADPPTHLTANGQVLTLLNASALLAQYTQSYGLNPTQFKATSTFTMVPDPSAPERKRQPKPTQDHQPPPDVLFHCTIAIPAPCPITSCASTGVGHRSKDIAKRHASYNYVKALLDQDEFDEDLNPTPKAGKKDKDKSRRPSNDGLDNCERKAKQVAILSGRDPGLQTEIRNYNEEYDELRRQMKDRLPPRTPAGVNGIPGIAEYERIASPAFWKTCPPLSPTPLHPVVIELLFDKAQQAHSASCRPMLLLTSEPLPIFRDSPTVDIDLSITDIGTDKARSSATARLTRGVKMKPWDDGKLQEAMIYTEKLVRAQLSKPVRAGLATARWVIVPLAQNFKRTRPDDLGHSDKGGIKISRRSVAWNEVNATQGPFCAPFDLDDADPSSLAQQIVDSLSCAKAEFSRRFYIQTLRTDLAPSSPHPNHPGSTILDIALKSSSKSDPSQHTTLQFPNQPIIMADQVQPAKAGGYVASAVLPHLSGNYLVPELIQRHIISASVFRTTSMLPHILSKIDDLIIAQDLSRELFSSLLTPKLALNALTCPSSQSQIPSQSYQRLELLGDCLLKLVSTIDMYLRHLRDPLAISTDNLHAERHLMVSNRALQANAVQAGIVPYIRSSGVRVKDWIPPSWTIDSPSGGVHTQVDNGTHQLGDKTVADVAEALIGAGYLSSPQAGIDCAMQIMQRLHIPLREMTQWSDANKFQPEAPRQNPPSGDAANGPTDRDAKWMQAFRHSASTVLGYEFADPQKVADVLSMSGDAGRRARFGMYKMLGDALLDYYVIDSLYARYPDAGPAALSHMRHARNGDTTLSALTVPLGLIKRLVDVPPDVAPLLEKYTKSVLEAQSAAHASGRPAKSPEEKREAEREWWHEVLPLTFLGDVTEAVVGAILVDSHFELERCRRLFQEHIEPFFERYCQGPEDRSLHPKSVLLELLSERGCTQWECRKGPSHSPAFSSTVWLHGDKIGTGKAEAQSIATRKACEEAVSKIKQGSLFDKLCTCPKRGRRRQTQGSSTLFFASQGGGAGPEGSEVRQAGAGP